MSKSIFDKHPPRVLSTFEHSWPRLHIKISREGACFACDGSEEFKRFFGEIPQNIIVAFDGKLDECAIPFVRDVDDHRAALGIVFSIPQLQTDQKFFLGTASLKSIVEFDAALVGSVARGRFVQEKHRYTLGIASEPLRFLDAVGKEIVKTAYRPTLI
jgi:hypothetical protein